MQHLLVIAMELPPIHKTKRWVKQECKRVASQTLIINMYSKEWEVSPYVINCWPRLRAKKWWWNLLPHILNLSVVTAFRFYEHVNPSVKMARLQFRRNVATSLVKRQTTRVQRGGPTTSPNKRARYDNVNYILTPCIQEGFFHFLSSSIIFPSSIMLMHSNISYHTVKSVRNAIEQRDVNVMKWPV